MSGRNRRDDHDTHKNIPASQTGSTESPDADLQDVAGAEGVSQADMNRDPLAGAMGQAPMQDDTIEDATTDDSGLPAKTDPAEPGGPASKNTSKPAGDQIGTGPDDVESGHAKPRSDDA